MTRAKLIAAVLILSLVSGVLAAPRKYGDTCRIDSDCNTELMVCSDSTQICKQKPLFPMLGREIGGMVLMVVLSMFAVVAGVGGGPLYVPILQMIFGMSARETVALSNALTMFSSVPTLIGNLNKMDPEIPRRSMVNYDVLLSMNPTFLLGSAIGATLGNFLPDIVRMVVFVLLILYSIYQAVKKTTSLLKKEEDAKKSATDKGLVSAQPTNRISDPAGAPTLLSVRGAESPENLGLQQDQQHPGARYEELPKLPNQNTEVVSAETTAAESLKIARISRVTRLESGNLRWPNVLGVGGSFLVAGLITLLRGGAGFTGWAQSKQCSTVDWILFSFFCFSMFVSSSLGSWFVLSKQQEKIALKIESINLEVPWSKSTCVKGWIFTIVMGACSSFSGLGGGSVMTPFFYSIGITPRSAAATSALAIFLSRIVVTIINYVVGVLPIFYMFFAGGLILLSGLVADNASGYILSRFKRQSFISAIFIGIICVCLVLFCVSSALEIKNSQENDTSLFEFSSYC